MYLYFIGSVLYQHMHLSTLILSDPFLPRVCELATSSSDRQTKVLMYGLHDSYHGNAVTPQVAACELLHALVLYMIGKSAQPVAQNKVT